MSDDGVVHGTSYRYKKGCRCDACRARNRERKRSNSGNAAPKITHGTRNRYRAGCRCDECLAWQRERSRRYAAAHREARRQWYEKNKRTHQALGRAWRQRENAKALDQATRNGEPWTGPDLELAARRDLTARQIAAALGRTLISVNNMRAALADRDDPRERMLAFGPVPPHSRS